LAEPGDSQVKTASAPSPSASPSRRLDYLDGLRGLAALLVIVQHCGEIILSSGGSLLNPLVETINLGRVGVILFFLISGFVIPFSFSGDRPLHNFAVSRVLRLYPAYWLSLMLAVIMGPYAGQVLSMGEIAGNATMLQKLFGIRNGWGVYWSLFFELLFYAMCAALFALRRLRSARVVAIVAGGFALAAAALPIAHYIYGLDVPASEDPIFVAYLFCGSLLRLALYERDASARRLVPLIIVLIFAAAMINSGAVFPVAINSNGFLGPMQLALAFTLPIALFVLVLAWRPAVPASALFFGRISYSLYLFQGAALIVLAKLLPPHPAALTSLAFVIGVVGTTTLMAWLVYGSVERPAITLGRRITHRAPPAMAAQVAP
jgi:peptidoglycan/LPS O-acetylase OafA/YrhL